ncbi:hypothetical protein PUNSTDRAFT_138595 [Punctularia strigosozonata HHB-11173 SS5]|uniref:Uncharacterized protein n=1 Tax=Punctularia strigosozonata (strain HHB-11173) TaxID=741275 RepID=R7S5A9_PUNST|nr:uncharacterized protein PUNSTDRAFT_138595 [Punctularia strigosozonata HHB-11173 SS5]EIN04551.1 hypothetical protein PUNSTDRAFT_138595 [Punctularia strigosozonata HHB-11173 SS5]
MAGPHSPIYWEPGSGWTKLTSLPSPGFLPSGFCSSPPAESDSAYGLIVGGNTWLGDRSLSDLEAPSSHITESQSDFDAESAGDDGKRRKLRRSDRIKKPKTTLT